MSNNKSKGKPTKKGSPKTKKTTVTNLIIVDASTSMHDKKQEVIGGLKEIFKQIRTDMKRDAKRVSVRNIVLDFSAHNDIQIILDSGDIEDLKDHVAEMYEVRGVTALYDAIGKGFSMVDEDCDAVFVNILTDGKENDSKKFTNEKVKELVTAARAKNWAVTFLGTTEEALSQAKQFGVSQGNMIRFSDSAEGMARAMKMSSTSRALYYSATMSEEGLNPLTVSNLMKAAEKKVEKDDKDLMKKTKKKKEE